MPEERSVTSARMFVRSQVLLAVASPRATGIRLTAQWAFHLFGYDLLRWLTGWESIRNTDIWLTELLVLVVAFVLAGLVLTRVIAYVAAKRETRKRKPRLTAPIIVLDIRY